MAYVTSMEKLGIERGLEQGLEQGRIEGEAKVLSLLITQRFPQTAEKFQRHLKNADSKTLLAWAARVFDAKTPEEIFQDK